MSLTLPDGPLWGQYNQSFIDSTTNEGTFGYNFKVYTYERHIDAAPTPNNFNTDSFAVHARNEGALLCVGVNPYTGSNPKTAIPGGNAAVGAGTYDNLLIEWRDVMTSYAATGGSIMAMYHLEPLVANAAQPYAGTAADYIAAFARAYSIWSAAGIKVGWDMDAADYNNNATGPYEPANYDVWSYDVYFENATPPPQTMAFKSATAVAFAQATGKPMILRSCGVDNQPPYLYTDQQNADWFHASSQYLLDSGFWAVAWDLGNPGLLDDPNSRPLTRDAFSQEGLRWNTPDAPSAPVRAFGGGMGSWTGR